VNLQTDSHSQPPSVLPSAAAATLPCNLLATQKALNAFYMRELSAPASYAAFPSAAEYAYVRQIESEWNAYETSRLELRDLPANVRQFDEWYIALRQQHRREMAPFFDFLADDASLAQVAFFCALEAHVDGKFDDIIALSQIGMSGDMKLALAENFWDEMGLGELEEMHTRVLVRGAQFFTQHTAQYDLAALVPVAALKNGNLLTMYALRRQYAARLLGNLTLLEQTVPFRFSRMLAGMNRHQVPKEYTYYHELHITVDANHGKQLVSRVLLPLARDNPEVIYEVCVGCLTRYEIEREYYVGAKAVMDSVIH
jgi:hypothetical protein